MKKTIVLGASPSSSRYAYLAVQRLLEREIEVFPVGIRKGEIQGVEIIIGKPQIPNIHTITLYLNPQRQREYYDYILGLKPERIIFNPGAENSELMELAKKAGIDTQLACTLVMLSLGDY